MVQSVEQTQTLIEFLRLGNSAREAQNCEELRFTIVNETFRLVQYRQAFLCTVTRNRIRLDTVSGLASIDKNSPFCDWFELFCRHIMHNKLIDQIRQFSSTDFPGQISDEWHEWLPDNLLLLPLTNRKRETKAILLLVSDSSFTNEEIKSVAAVCEVYAHAMMALEKGYFISNIFMDTLANNKIRFILFAATISLLFIKINQTSLGNAEVTADIYRSIASPFDGVINKIVVKPNQVVKKGELLFALDDTTIRNKLESANRSMGVAKSEEFLSRQKSFFDHQSRSEIATQEAKVREKGTTVSYMREMLSKMEVKSPESGTVLFGDPTDWEGKPVSTGERVMTLADEQSANLTVWVSTSDTVPLLKGGKIRLFLNTDPLHPLEASIVRTSYQPVISPEGIASYRVTAELSDKKNLPRLGLKGVAKVYGEKVYLGYYIFRRPIASFRQYFGW